MNPPASVDHIDAHDHRFDRATHVIQSVGRFARWQVLSHSKHELPFNHRDVAKLGKLKDAEREHRKGRPVRTGEVGRVLDKVESGAGQGAAASWEDALRGIWESALRLNELLHVSWDISGTIQPVWKKGRLDRKTHA